MKNFDISTFRNILFVLSVLILLFNFFKKNNNFFDVRNIFVEQFKMFKDCKGQFIVYYIVPLFLAVATVTIKCIDKDIINNLVIFMSIFISMLFTMLSIISNYKSDNSRYVITLNETHNTILFECILSILILIVSFVVFFAGNYEEGLILYIISCLLYYLIFTLILHVLMIMKRMKVLFEEK